MISEKKNLWVRNDEFKSQLFLANKKGEENDLIRHLIQHLIHHLNLHAKHLS